ncbi:hypothetical protein TVAG_403170 [Trichomonas vaginalis G3]|uniref:Uncharacterized protein n=1 Tax=Trichomonas vaginalis (strain ATCC PRA-98 / G3) TaxID=412133 RepID=A2F8V3_TRIV3|nr:hypothetical protein TVAGG3_0689350 [Trichomonas vaginalis G3]EAX98635.1 hypothetical protein TVAG_403170 [Trichomonas vaginalis G3]KAI5508451.1 hypothetical protein TVAGG3_0689350 [Trichomonas vaginalis G3]|eukprot:XP_001311565.1 hypothetical protein [Trichomonas vaginalis G3]
MTNNVQTLQEEQWDDKVFVSRQKEIVKLSQNFADAVDKLITEKPFIFEHPEIEEEEYEYVEEEEEIEINNLNADSLIIIHQIVVLQQDIDRLISGLSPNLIQKNQYIAKVVNQLHSLSDYMETLRVRAENLLSPI